MEKVDGAEQEQQTAEERSIEGASLIGSVPSIGRVAILVERLNNVLHVLRHLCLDSNPTRVLLLHGMGGSGKTVFAAQIVAHARFEGNQFPTRVLWLSVGCLSEKEDDSEGGIVQLLLIRLLNELSDISDISRLSISGCETVDSMKALLKKVLTHSRILLVLDDVWESDAVALFDGMPVVLIVTSRIDSIANRRKAKVKAIPLTKCTESEARGIATISSGPLEENAMRLLLNRCDGLPLALVIMAATLAGKSNEQQLELLMAESPVEWGLRPFSQLPIKYKNLVEAFEVSFVDLQRNTSLGKQKLGDFHPLDLYCDLAVLNDDDEEVFTEMIRAVWNLTEAETDELLRELASRRLFQSQQTPFDPTNSMALRYKVHSMQLDFIRELVKIRENGSMVSRHRRWVEGWLRRLGMHELVAKSEQTVSMEYASELSLMFRVMEFDGDWWKCSDELLAVLECWQDMSPIEQEITKILLPKNGKTGWNVVLECCRRGVTSALRTLSENNLVDMRVATQHEIEFEEDEGYFSAGCSAVHVLAAFGNVESLQYLVENGIDVHATDARKMTALHYASREGEHEMVHHLIELGMDMNAINEEGKTAFHVACDNGHQQVAQYLADNGADVIQEEDETAQHAASAQ